MVGSESSWALGRSQAALNARALGLFSAQGADGKPIFYGSKVAFEEDQDVPFSVVGWAVAQAAPVAVIEQFNKVGLHPADTLMLANPERLVSIERHEALEGAGHWEFLRAHREERADGEPHQNSRTFELETGMQLEGWPGRKQVRWMARRIAKDCAEFYLSKVYYGFEGDANILLDAMRENEENRDIIEEMRVPCGPKGDKGYVGSDRAPAPDEHPANRVLPEEIAALMASAEFFDEKRYGNTTVVTAKLPNGWTITEQSACIDPDNYDHDLGVEICKKRIEDELWKLEGYRKVCERAVRDGEQG